MYVYHVCILNESQKGESRILEIPITINITVTITITIYYYIYIYITIYIYISTHIHIHTGLGPLITWQVACVLVICNINVEYVYY